MFITGWQPSLRHDFGVADLQAIEWVALQLAEAAYVAKQQSTSFLTSREEQKVLTGLCEGTMVHL